MMCSLNTRDLGILNCSHSNSSKCFSVLSFGVMSFKGEHLGKVQICKDIKEVTQPVRMKRFTCHSSFYSFADGRAK